MNLCMVDYNYHDDASPNADMTAIRAAAPAILIDNTPGGLWGGGCLPKQYPDTEVYSYITGGYEGTQYKNSQDQLTANLVRIEEIRKDGAAGVFLDEVSSHPDPKAKTYLTLIADKCKAFGLKLIFNTGVSTFDPGLMSQCDYLLTAESYNERLPTDSERPFASRILVVNNSVLTAAVAIEKTQAAWSSGFGHAWCCRFPSYYLPDYLSEYVAGLVPPAPPVPPTPTPMTGTFTITGTGTFTFTSSLDK